MPTTSDLKAARAKRGRSLRARARALYRKNSHLRAAKPKRTGPPGETKAAPDEATVAPLKIPTALTRKLRALYEDSVVPVAELARLAGVTERTLYKYVQRGGWRRRYTRRPLWKGTGGRFVSRDQASRPQLCGLGALDADAAARRLRACKRAGRLAADAVSRTLASERCLREFEARVRTLALLTQAWRELTPRADRKRRYRLPRPRRRGFAAAPLRRASPGRDRSGVFA
jgi:hypothetical protein